MAVIKDVAKLSGLSVAVVSKYLNHPDTVRADTKARIDAAIKELNYVPSVAARSMRTKRSEMIAVVVPDIQDEFYAVLFNWIKVFALARGYTPILYTTENDSETLRGYLGKMSINYFDGIIPCYINEEILFSERDKMQGDLPVVVMGALERESVYPGVVIDLCKGSYLATRHLIEQGYSRVAFVGGLKESKITTAKFDGYCEALKENGLPIHEEYIVYGKANYQTGCAFAEQCREKKSWPDAVVAANDVVAAGFMKRALSSGIRIPEDVGVIGFDDIPLAEMYEPGISTIAIPSRDMCRDAVNMLIDRIESRERVKAVTLFDAEVIFRKSSDKGGNLK